MAGCSCGKADNTFIFSCSGGSDVGGLSERIARALAKGGVGRMYCLAGIGAAVPGMLETAKGACSHITIDGCPVNCAKKILEQAGFSPRAFNLKDLGYEKGKTSVDDATVDAAIVKMGI